jgi:hypothetical protein
MRPNPIGVFAASLLVVVAGLAIPAPIAAKDYRNASAGSACHPANGAMAAKFNYNMHYLTNVGTTDAYVICDLQMDDATSLPEDATLLAVNLLLPDAGTTVTCIAQAGVFYDGMTSIYKSQSRTWSTGFDNQPVRLEWTGIGLARTHYSQVLTLNCKLPPGAKMGLIQREEAS